MKLLSKATSFATVFLLIVNLVAKASTDRHDNVLPSTSFDVKWTNLLGVTNAGGGLTKTALEDTWGNSGANSLNILPANQDGWFEFTIDNSNSNYAIAFATDGTFGLQALLNGIAVGPGQIYYVESGASSSMGAAQVGDIIRVSREGSVIRYYQNGQILRTTNCDATIALGVNSTIWHGSSPSITASFDTMLRTVPTFTSPSGTQKGGMQLTTEGGTSPYNYQWSSGETTSSISNKTTGTYSVTITDALGKTSNQIYYLGYQAQWQDITNATLSNGGLIKSTANANWGDCGANSTNVLAGNQDGWLQFVVNNDGSIYSIGFATAVDFEFQSVHDGIYIDGGKYYYNEPGDYQSIGTWQQGDLLRVSREGNTVKYYHNNIVAKTFTVNPALELKIKTTIYKGTAPSVTSSFDARLYPVPIFSSATSESNGGIQLVMQGGTAPYVFSWSTGEKASTITNKPVGSYAVTVTDAHNVTSNQTFYLGQQVQWQDLTGANDSNGVLEKKMVADNSWGNSGANSTFVLSANQNGWLQFVVDGKPSIFSIGFATASNFNFSDILNGIHINSDGNCYLDESGAYPLVGTWQEADLFRISREGDKVKYYRNNVIIKTVTVDPSLELRVKSTIYHGFSPLVISSFGLISSDSTKSNRFCENIYCNGDGGVGIDTRIVPDGYTLAVKGKIISEGVKVLLQSNWPDYVFKKDYKLAPLHEVDNYIQKHGHLPNMPSTEEVKKEGVDLGSMDAKLLRKIEELTLYIIELKKEIETLKPQQQK